ncbi:MAG: hypothetical protein JSS02_13780 [Planctomycetes bacterium]|nr:hypothetical protein [Planctomycetota bacterium]
MDIFAVGDHRNTIRMASSLLLLAISTGGVRLAVAQDASTEGSATDSKAARKALASQKQIARQQFANSLRTRRAQSQRAAGAFDDLFGQGASSQVLSSGLTAASSTGNSTAANSTTLNGADAAGSSTATTDSTSADSNIGRRIVKFAVSQLGNQVGDGSSRALIDAVLSSANAKTAEQNLTTSLNSTTSDSSSSNTGRKSKNGHCSGSAANQVGQSITLEQAKPGDIVHFENAIFVGLNYWMIMGTPDQWAIVYLVRGNEVILLDQDVNGVKQVQYTTINLADLHSGTVNAYRPVAKETSIDSNSSPPAPSATTTNSTSSDTSSASQSGTTGSGSTSRKYRR